MTQGKIVKISGPLVVAEGMQDADMFDVVRVGEQNLIGEIIEMRDGMASIQVYEETAGLKPGTSVYSHGSTAFRRTRTRTDRDHVRWYPETAEGHDGIIRPEHHKRYFRSGTGS